MKEYNLQLKIDGPDLEDHSIDVSILAPMLEAFGNILSVSNSLINEDRSKSQVKIKADLKANCVTLDFGVLVSVYEQVKQLVANPETANAKEILEWIGLIGPVTAGSIWYFIKKGEGSISNETTITNSDNSKNTSITLVGDNNTINIGKQSTKLINDATYARQMKRFLSPLANEKGIDSLTFKSSKEDHYTLNKQDAQAALAGIKDIVDDSSDSNILEAHITIYSPTLSETSKTWSFLYGDNKISVDISETDIVRTILNRGKVVIGDTFHVKLEVTQTKRNGKYVVKYKAIEVLDFEAGLEQSDLID